MAGARAILHGRCGGRRSRSLDFGGRIWLGAGLLGDPFGTRVGDRLAGDRWRLRRSRFCCRRRRRRSWRRGAGELVVGRVALLPEIPALTFGDAVDAIVPMAARGGRALRRGQATVRGGLGRWRGGFRCCCIPGPGDPSRWPGWRLPRHRQGEPGRISRNGSTCTTPATQRNATLDAPNLVRDLGRNEPQFRSGWGIIGAGGPPQFEAGYSPEKPAFFYCLEAVQRPVQPSDRTNEPEPVRPEKRPVLFQLKPWTDPPLLVEPFGLTDPRVELCRYSRARIVVFDRCGRQLDTTVRSRGAVRPKL